MIIAFGWLHDNFYAAGGKISGFYADASGVVNTRKMKILHDTIDIATMATGTIYLETL